MFYNLSLRHESNKVSYNIKMSQATDAFFNAFLILIATLHS